MSVETKVKRDRKRGRPRRGIVASVIRGYRALAGTIVKRYVMKTGISWRPAGTGTLSAKAAGKK